MTNEITTGIFNMFQFITPPLHITVKNYNLISKSLIDPWTAATTIALIKTNEDNPALNLRRNPPRDILEKTIIEVEKYEKQELLKNLTQPPAITTLIPGIGNGTKGGNSGNSGTII